MLSAFTRKPLSLSKSSITSNYFSCTRRYYSQQMHMKTLHGLNCAILPPKAEHKSTVIWAHGLGDSHEGFQGLFEMVLQTPDMKVVLPNAPKIPITVNGGMRMPGWYDIKKLGMERKYNADEEDVEGLLASADKLAAIVNDEINELGGDAKRVIMGGFSQGAALSLLTCYGKLDKTLGGLICCSGYWCLRNQPEVSLKHKNHTPMLMWHGKYDQVVPFTFAMDGYKQLEVAYGEELPMEEHVGPFDHSMEMDQVHQIKDWIQKRLSA